MQFLYLMYIVWGIHLIHGISVPYCSCYMYGPLYFDLYTTRIDLRLLSPVVIKKNENCIIEHTIFETIVFYGKIICIYTIPLWRFIGAYQFV